MYPGVYCNSEQCSFDLKSKFQIKLKEFKDKKIEQLGKNPPVYKIREEVFGFQQKQVNVADFTEEEGKK